MRSILSTAHMCAARVLLAAALAAVLSVGAASAQTLRGVALVIGNGAYEHLPALANPANDARAMESLLDRLGFTTTLALDRDARRLARELDIFVEDARGADVAILYYAGHGIEAGGQNILVPVDANPAALEAAGEKLAPVLPFLERLRATVPLAIVLLDACRDNPFPPGAAVRLDAASAPVPMGDAGLGETRGALRLLPPRPGVESIGTVIAFAAEPGRVALDGEAGANSPYAAALLRHLDAMASGEEFGTVMRMVAEEVWLRTAGRQRPWINESLRRLLYFGRSPEAPAGDEGDILAERRQLLLTIAELPDASRSQVARAARDGEVPMDAVFGMIAALGHEMPDDPARLGELLRAETERFRKILAEREAIDSPDPEIVRLSDMADRAEAEGLLGVAGRLRDDAKARFAALEPTLLARQAALDQRFIEGAAVFARSAETRTLAFDHLGAARDYVEALRLLGDRDPRLSLRYRHGEMLGLTQHGNWRGDNEALQEAIEAGRAAETLALSLTSGGELEAAHRAFMEASAGRGGGMSAEEAAAAFFATLERSSIDGERLAALRHDLAMAMQTLGQRRQDNELLREAAGYYELVLTRWTREDAPAEWARTTGNLGLLYVRLGEGANELAPLQRAVELLGEVLEVQSADAAPDAWAAAKINLGSAYWSLGQRDGRVETIRSAADAFRDALTALPREADPLSWAAAQANLGIALMAIGQIEESTDLLGEAVRTLELAMEERPRDRVPLEWASTLNNLGNALMNLGELSGDIALIERSAGVFGEAMEEWTRDRVPLQWAAARQNLGNSLALIGRMRSDRTRLGEAVQAYRSALEVWTADIAPFDRARTSRNLALVLGDLAELDKDAEAALRVESIASFREALGIWSRDYAPAEWARTQNELAASLVELALLDNSIPRLQEASQAYQEVVRVWTREAEPYRWAATLDRLGVVLIIAGELTRSKVHVEEGRSLFARAWDVYRERGVSDLDAHFAARLQLADDLLAGLE